MPNVKIRKSMKGWKFQTDRDAESYALEVMRICGWEGGCEDMDSVSLAFCANALEEAIDVSIGTTRGSRTFNEGLVPPDL